MKTHCIIVDDEPLARDLLSNYLAKIDNLELVAVCSTALEAFRVLREKKVDLVFLDINMPQISGIEFLRSLNNPPRVIFITAHKEYALDGFELDVVDYLLKPVSFSRLLKAIDKYYQVSGSSNPLYAGDPAAGREFIYLKENKKVMKVFLDEIDYIEAMGEYCQIYTEGKRLIPKMSIKALEEMLGDKDFIRIHKSILLPVKKISAFSASTVEINKKKELPIGRSYKSSVLHALQYNGKLQDSW